MRRYFGKRSFEQKLIIIFVIIVLIPLLLCTMVTYSVSKKFMEEKIFDHLQNLASVTMSKVEMSVENVEDMAFYVAGNVDMQSLLSKTFEPKEREQRLSRYDSVRDLLSYYVLLSKEISSIYIESTEQDIFSYGKINDVPPMEELKKLEGQWQCYGGRIYFQRNLNRFSDQELLGKMVAEVQAPVFYDIVKDIFSMADSRVYIVDEDYNIIAGKDRLETGKKLEGAYLSEQETLVGGFHKAVLGKKTYTVLVGDTIHNGWRLILALPESYYLDDIRDLQVIAMLVALLAGMAAIIAIIFAGRSLARPLKILSNAMEDVGQGDFEVSLPVNREDEIGVLTKTFNQMVRDMQMLIDNVYEKEMMKQEVEMKSLQMQINPHFLYNTLDTINWIARMRGVTEVGEMTSALGNLMRYSLAKKDFVTIGEELNSLRNYIEIQNVRYGDRMSIEFQVQEEVQEYYIPKLLVQPILENAIVHGVEDKLESGTIQINIYSEEEDLYIVVEDDGVGMTQEAIESLISMDYDSNKKGHTSIGVYNVNRRIQKVFGSGCGLQIQSQLGAGTKITLHLKILTSIPDIRLKYN